MTSNPVITHVTPSYLPTLGGKETYIYDIVEGLPDLDFVVLTSWIWGLQSSERGGRVHVIRVGPPDPYRGPRALPSPGRVELFLGHGFSTVRLVRQRRLAEASHSAVVHSHWSDIEFAEAFRGLTSEVGRRRLVERALRIATFRKPTVFTDHSMFLQDLSTAERMLLEHALRAYDAVVCVEPEGAIRARAMAEDVGGTADVEYIPNSVNCDLFRPADRSNAGPPTICYLGRANKGYHIVFDLIQRLSGFRFLLVVAGDRRSLKKWRAITSDRVQVRENVPPSELPAALQRSDIVVSPLLHSGITRVTLEALACGVPIVAAVGESRYPLVHGKTGFLVQPLVDDFERAVRQLLRDEALRRDFGKEGRRLVQAEFSDQVVLPRLRAVYKRLAG